MTSLTTGSAPGSKVALFAFDYEDRPSKAYYPRGCLARFNVSADGHVTEAAP